MEGKLLSVRVVGEGLSDEVGLELSPETLVLPGDRRRELMLFWSGHVAVP